LPCPSDIKEIARNGSSRPQGAYHDLIETFPSQCVKRCAASLRCRPFLFLPAVKRLIYQQAPGAPMN
jgi:hypothetical protein